MDDIHTQRAQRTQVSMTVNGFVRTLTVELRMTPCS